MGFVKEFKEFAFKGNVIELAVAVIIGAAFGRIITSLVDDIITPLLLSPALESMGAENIAELTWNGTKYGNFLSAIINFLCIALVLFLMIRSANKMKKKKEATAPAGPTSEQLLIDIKEILKKK